MAWRIFISYRRRDDVVLAFSATLYRQLEKLFPKQVFRDEQELPLGQPFPEQLESALQSCEAMLVCIHDPAKWVQGASWNIHQEEDWVRREIETGLKRGIAVIPVIFQPRGRMPESTEVPETIRPLLGRQKVEIDFSRGDWDTWQLPAFGVRLRREMPVPKDRHVLCDELYALLAARQSLTGRTLHGLDLAKLYLLCTGLERVPEVIRHQPRQFALTEALSLLKCFQGNQLFGFGRGCRDHFGVAPTAEDPLNAWLSRDPLAAAPSLAVNAGARLRLQFVLHPKSHWPMRCEALQVHGSLRLGTHAIRITSEEIPEAICVPGKDLGLVLEPVMTGLVNWLHQEIGKEMSQALEPRLEFFAMHSDERLGDPLNWPLERVRVGDSQLGEMFALCRRLYQRHLCCGEKDRLEWEKRSQQIEGTSLDAADFFSAPDWKTIRSNPWNRHRLFLVADGEAAIPGEELIRRAYPAGLWSRKQREDWTQETGLLICEGGNLVSSLPESLREVRSGAPQDSPWHDVAVLYDPFETFRPHDPHQETKTRKATRSAALL